MSDYEIIDVHVHLHRNITMEKQSFPVPGRRDRDRWGNVSSVIAYMDREGISKIVCLNLFPTEQMRKALLEQLPADVSGNDRLAAEEQVEKGLASRLRRHNEWICNVGKENPRLIPGIGMQKLITPQEMAEEVEVRAAQGARTVKLIPGRYLYYPNDHHFWPMYEKCQELGIAVTSDTGLLGPITAEGLSYGRPANFIEVLESFPRLRLVMCHLASAFWDERVEIAQRYPNLYFDLAGGFKPPDSVLDYSPLAARDRDRAAAEEDAVRIIRKVGADRIMFGTDGPGHMVQMAIEQVLRLDLNEGEKRLILAENAKRIYRI
ncbi:MAG: amidohydrolase [Chloroflexi bacterium]|nr:amidohydrolase [Chloroflexota bacterium]